MKKIILLLLLVFLGMAESHAQGWEWKEPTLDSKILKDLDDNVYVFSNASSSFTIRKLDIYGTTLWTKTGTGNATISAYKIYGNNDLIVLGNLTSSTTINTFTLVPLGTQSFFILKIAPASTVLSANVYGSLDKTFANDLFITASGDYLIGGGFSGSFNMNGSSVIGDTLQNFFILKTDNNQNLLWSEKSNWITPSTGYGEAFIDELVETTSGKIYAEIKFYYGLLEYKGFQFTTYGGCFIQLDNARNITWESSLYTYFTQTSDFQTNGDTVYMKENFNGPHSSNSQIYMCNDSGIKSTIGYSGPGEIGYAVANGKIYYAFKTGNASYLSTFCYSKIGSLTLGLSEQGQPFDSVVTSWGSYSEVQYINPTSLFISGYDYGMNSFFVGKYNMSIPTSVNTNDERNQFQIYPNPTSGQFTLQLNGDLQKQVESNDMIFVFDQLGNCVLRQQFSNSSTQQIDISKMAKGIYFVEVETGKERMNKKIVLN